MKQPLTRLACLACVVVALSACAGSSRAGAAARAGGAWDEARLRRASLECFQAWKARYFNDRALPPGEPRQSYVDYLTGVREDPSFDWGDRRALTVSEAHGYGMLAIVGTAAIDDYYRRGSARGDFDAFLRLFLAFPSGIDRRLMTWQLLGRGIDPETGAGNTRTMDAAQAGDSATDGDLDMAYALILASRLWPDGGYAPRALELIDGLRESCMDFETGIPLLGDWARSPGQDPAGPYYRGTRSSDFMLGHFLAFAGFDAVHSGQWKGLADDLMEIIARVNRDSAASTGLMPDFLAPNPRTGLVEPVAGEYLESPNDGDYSWNACRFPWRLGAYCLAYGDARATKVLADGTAYIRALTRDNPDAIPSGAYIGNGTPGSPLPGSDYPDLSFIAPWAVAASCAPGAEAWKDRLLDRICSWKENGMEGYFGDSIRMLVLLTLAGAFR